MPLSIQKIFFIALLICCSLCPASYAQQSPQALFDKANKKLNAGHVQQAVSGYHALEENQHLSGALFINLGIAYQRLDSLGKAKYYFLKASRFEETRDHAKQALHYIKPRFSHQSAVLPQLPWDVATHWLQFNLGAPLILLIGLILLNSAVLLFIAHWFARRGRHFLRTISFTFATIAVLIIALSFYTRYVTKRYHTAVTITQKAAITEKPTSNSSLVSDAFEGYTLIIDHFKSKKHPQWSYVRMSNGLYGWIPNDQIMSL